MSKYNIYKKGLINDTFAETVSSAVHVDGTNKNIKEYVDEEQGKALNNLEENYYKKDYIKKSVYSSDKVINVLDLGIIPNSQNATIVENNTSILKRKIEENFTGGVAFYFPAEGTYYFNSIYINSDTTHSLRIALIGADLGYIHINHTNNRVRINSNGDFIVRTNTTGTTDMFVSAKNICFISNNIDYSKQPTGTCFGRTGNTGDEINFDFYNVMFNGYEYGFYSNGYSCNSNANYLVLDHCKYGIFIRNASHDLCIEKVDIGYCYRGITLCLGGHYCYIKKIHVATGMFSGMSGFLNEDPRSYAIYTSGGLEIDGMYYEEYSPDNGLTPDEFSIIDYEGNNYAGKLVVKNCPIGKPGFKGYFFRGATFQGEGALLNSSPLYSECGRGSLWQRGCVEFYNCLKGANLNAQIKTIKSCFKIREGLNNAAGYVFDDRDIYGCGVAFTKHPVEKIRSFISASSNGKTVYYKRSDVDSSFTKYNGVPFNRKGSNFLNSYGIHLTGYVDVSNLSKTDTDVTYFLHQYIPGVGNKPIKNLFILNSNTINLYKTLNNGRIYIDEIIEKKDAEQFFIGVTCNSDSGTINNVLPVANQQEIIWNIDVIMDEDEYQNYKKVESITPRIIINNTSLEKNDINLVLNTNSQLMNVTFNPSDTSESLYTVDISDEASNYVHSNRDIVFTNDFRIYPDAVGSTTVTLTNLDNSDVTATINVNVTSVETPVEKVSLDTTTSTLSVGQTLQLTTTVTPSASNSSVEYYSTDTNIATVSGSGLVEAKASGKCSIFVLSSENSCKGAVCNITVS